MRRRVALLAGVSADVLDSVYRERLRPNPGAAGAIRSKYQQTIYTASFWRLYLLYRKATTRAGFKQTQANTLEIIDGKLTGKVIGDIVDGAAKILIWSKPAL